MSRNFKKDQNESMILLLENMKNITKNMQIQIDLAEESVREFLHQMVKIKKANAKCKGNKRCENIELYNAINELLFKYYDFNELEDGKVTMRLRNEAFMKNNKNIVIIKSLISGNENFAKLEEVLDKIEKQRNLFFENILKLKKIKESNKYIELEEIFDYIGTLKFDNECTLNGFNRALNLKLKELKQR